MAELVGRNELCTCGSGKKYKKCCLDKTDNTDSLLYCKRLMELKNAGRIKECLYPDHSSCSGKIIKAHSIQNNAILTMIAEDGKVLMPKPKYDVFPSDLTEYGRKEATTFTGFCSIHDKSIFQPIEDNEFIGSKEQVFLFIYRAFSAVYYGKLQSRQIVAYRQKYNTENTFSDEYNGWELAVADLKSEKDFFDNCLINKEYDGLTSIIWEFSGFSHFAASGMDTPTIDFCGNNIQDLSDKNYVAKHIYYYVFPQKTKTFVIIAWKKEFNHFFSNIYERLRAFTEEERKNYISNKLPIITDNIVIKPSSWRCLSKSERENFLFLCFADPLISDDPNNCLSKPPFDLFLL